MMVSSQGMLHVKLVQRAYELSDAVGATCREDHLPEITALVETLAAVLQRPLATEVSDDVALVARLVLEDHAAPAPQASRCFSAAGSAALQLIQQAAFACAPAGLAFVDLVRCTSTQQAAMVCSMCHAALHDVICDSGTCIQLLMTAEAQHWRSLESRCLDVAVEDPSGSLGAAVADLSEHALKRILSSDNLKVECELDVWHMLQQWLDADLTARSRSVASFMTGPLRLLQLSRSDLNELDCHPAIRRCGISSRLVAAAYLHASGHSANLCSQMALPPLWAQLATSQPRLSLAAAAQPATPDQAIRSAPAGSPLHTGMSDDSRDSPPFRALTDVTPVRMHMCSPTAEMPSAQEAVALSPGGPWMISSEDWDDATETACWEKINLARHKKRVRRL